MDLSEVIDFVDQAHDEIGRYKVEVTLSPDKLMNDAYCVAQLKWKSVLYGPDEVAKVPNDRRGVYAFAICHENDVLPPNGCVLYVGIAGRKSNRSLRERYRDYLSQRQILKRERIARMIGTWHPVLRFFFAPVDEDFSSADLEQLESQLNTALLPKYSVGDLEAETKRKRRAFE